MLKYRITVTLKNYIFDNSILLFVNDLEREKLIEHMINIGDIENILAILKLLLKYNDLNFNIVKYLNVFWLIYTKKLNSKKFYNYVNNNENIEDVKNELDILKSIKLKTYYVMVKKMK